MEVRVLMLKHWTESWPGPLYCVLQKALSFTAVLKGTSEFKAGSDPVMDWHPIKRGVGRLSLDATKQEYGLPSWK